MNSEKSARTIIFGATIDYQLRYHDGLYQKLAAQGWRVHLISSPGPISESLASVPSVFVHALPMQREPSPLPDLIALIRWIRLVRLLKPDIVVTGTPKAGLLGSMSALICRVPVRIYELHGLRLETTGGPLRALLKLVERLTCSAATSVIAVGNSLRERALRERLSRAGKIKVLGAGSPNGVDVRHFACASADEHARSSLRERLRLTEADVVVSFVGRLTADKGIDSFASALARVQNRARVVALVIGGTDDESGTIGRERLLTLVERVTLVGDVKDVAPYLAASDIFCLPSRREGLPTVVLEAFSAGVPVVATAATGNVDLVVDEHTGILVPIDDANALANALLRLIDDQTIAPQLVERARAMVTSSFDRELVQGRWISMLYARLEGSVPPEGGA